MTKYHKEGIVFMQKIMLLQMRGREIGMGFGKPCLFILTFIFTVEWEYKESNYSTRGEKLALEVMSLEVESGMRITQYNDEGHSKQSTATNNGSGRWARRLFWDKDLARSSHRSS